MAYGRKQVPVLAAEPQGPLMLALRERTVPNLVWRFYTDAKHRWKWQHLTVLQEVVSESAKGYKRYEECLADAKEHGYVFQPSQAKRPSVVPHYHANR